MHGATGTRCGQVRRRPRISWTIRIDGWSPRPLTWFPARRGRANANGGDRINAHATWRFLRALSCPARFGLREPRDYDRRVIPTLLIAIGACPVGARLLVLRTCGPAPRLGPICPLTWFPARRGRANANGGDRINAHASWRFLRALSCPARFGLREPRDYDRRVIPILLIAIGACSVGAGILVLRTFGAGYRIG